MFAVAWKSCSQDIVYNELQKNAEIAGSMCSLFCEEEGVGASLLILHKTDVLAITSTSFSPTAELVSKRQLFLVISLLGD